MKTLIWLRNVQNLPMSKRNRHGFLRAEWVAEANFPQGFLLCGVGEEWVYEAARDSLDVEFVRVYRRAR
jgi:hypothetical protein